MYQIRNRPILSIAEALSTANVHRENSSASLLLIPIATWLAHFSSSLVLLLIWKGSTMSISLKPISTSIALAFGGLYAGVAAGPALAQAGAAGTAVQREDTVVVTGSRINRSSNVDSPIPVVTVDSEQFSNLGVENFADLATQLPQFAPAFGASRTQSTFSGVAASGLNLVNLRNLGSLRSLVLINGRRVPGGTATSTAVDFNTIPTANIDRVEVITGGAAAVYGADAVAGVVNIITRKNFEGIETNLGYGAAQEGDNENPTASIIMGGRFGDRGRASLTLQYDRQGRVSCVDRYICAEDFFWGSPATQLRGPPAYSAVGTARFFIGNTSYTSRNGSFTDANGNLIVFSTPIDGYNRNPQRDIAIPTTRIMAAADAEYEVGKQVRAFAEINYGQAEIDSQFEGHPFQSSALGSRFGTLQPSIPVNNPFIPPELRAVIPSGTTEITWWQRFSPETIGGYRGAKSERNTIRTAVGLRGELDTLFGVGSDWRWEVSYVYGRTRENLGTEGLVGTGQLYYGLRVEPDPANPGSFRCADPGARGTGCIPINPFAPYTQAMKDYLRVSSNTIGANSLNDTVAFLNGTVLELPSGSLRAVIGAQYRTFSGYRDYDEVINRGLATGNQIGDIDYVKIDTREAFAEVQVPILANKPFAKALHFQGAYRFSDTKEDSYGTWNLGGDWEPVDGFRVRAMMARSVRAPTPGELSGVGQTFGVVNDPCTASRRNLNPTRAANCAADGVPANYSPPIAVEQSVGGLTGGNPALKPERGDTVTYGFVWQPTFARDLILSVDRFDIEVDGLIRTVSRQIAVNTCYDTVGRELCGVVTRGTNPLLPGATYVLTSVNEQLQNVAKQTVSGFDIQIRYLVPFRQYGDFDLSLNASYYDEAILVPLAGSTPIDLLGPAGGSTTDQGYIRLTGSANIAYRFHNFSANWNVRYIGAAEMGVGSRDAGFPSVPSHTYHNIRVGYQLGKSGEIYGGITNLFDKEPPFFASGYSGTQALDTIPAYYDVFGRSYFVGFRYKF